MPHVAARRLLSLTVALTVCVTPLAQAAPAAAVAPPRPAVSLPAPVSGDAAIEALGRNLPAVAQAHGKSADALTRALKTDRRLVVDRKGRLFYRDAPATAAELAAAPSADTLPAAAPLEQTFALHSKPGAKRTIFLDFDGFTLAGTAWNGGSVPDPLVCPPWDVDGSPSSFGTSERTTIQNVWQRVAEDYLPFDVDVTTQDPGEAAMSRDGYADEYYGVRVLVSPISAYFGNYGGIAYVSAFDSVNSALKPALVFPEMLANNEKYVGEACAHEAGHTLGLLHDGTSSGGEYYAGYGDTPTSWAPIMGNGYYRPVTQWSRGEYPLANNAEDDLATIQQHGCAWRADDYADTPAGAAGLPAGTSLAAGGIVGRTGDVDVVAFAAGAGPLTLAVAPAAVGANLDVALELRDASGALVASADPAGKLAASISAVVPDGTYYLAVRSAGDATPAQYGYSAYASLGAWRLTGTVTEPTTTVAPPPPPPNALPTAVIAAPGSATAGTAIAFDGSASSDPDGSIGSWSWSFGDGATATGAKPTHAYASAGTYVVTLTVTDDAGAAATARANVVVTAPPAPAQKLHVASIALTYVTSKAGRAARAVVTVADAEGRTVTGATVTGTWSGVVTGTSSAVTGTSGAATLTSKNSKRTGTITFSVTGVSKTGYAYDATANAVTRASIALTKAALP